MNFDVSLPEIMNRASDTDESNGEKKIFYQDSNLS